MSSPSFVAPLKNSTLLTEPFASLALAAIVTEAGAVKVAPLVGEVRLTTGGVLPPVVVAVMVTAEEVVVAPWLSVATAVSV